LTTDLAIQAIEEERRRLARDIHDGPAQLLTNLTMRLEVVKEMIKYSPQTALPEIQRIQDLMRSSVGELRRMIYDLRPVEVSETGLTSAVSAYAERCQYLLRVPVSVRADGEYRDLGDMLAVGVFRVVQECVTNCLKHARAQRIEVELARVGDKLCATVRDDGIGFVPGEEEGGFGLVGMRERARLIGATVEVRSQPGLGTEVTLVVPLLVPAARE
jgi:signal transduction histidine kinase